MISSKNTFTSKLQVSLFTLSTVLTMSNSAFANGQVDNLASQGIQVDAGEAAYIFEKGLNADAVTAKKAKINGHDFVKMARDDHMNVEQMIEDKINKAGSRAGTPSLSRSASLPASIAGSSTPGSAAPTLSPSSSGASTPGATSALTLSPAEIANASIPSAPPVEDHIASSSKLTSSATPAPQTELTKKADHSIDKDLQDELNNPLTLDADQIPQTSIKGIVGGKIESSLQGIYLYYKWESKIRCSKLGSMDHFRVYNSKLELQSGAEKLKTGDKVVLHINDTTDKKSGVISSSYDIVLDGEIIIRNR